MLVCFVVCEFEINLRFLGRLTVSTVIRQSSTVRFFVAFDSLWFGFFLFCLLLEVIVWLLFWGFLRFVRLSACLLAGLFVDLGLFSID